MHLHYPIVDNPHLRGPPCEVPLRQPQVHLPAIFSWAIRERTSKCFSSISMAHGFMLANYGPGSPGNETELYGNATQYQLIQFPKAERHHSRRGLPRPSHPRSNQ